MGKTYQITIIGMEGQHKIIDVATTEEAFNNTTILEFKRKLVEKLPGNKDPSELRLLFAAKQLNDDDKLSDHGIKDKSTLMVVVRLDGGGKHPMDSLFTL